MRKKIRRSIDKLLTALGIVVIFAAVLMSSALTVKMQLPIVLLGVLLLEAGVWGLSSKVFLNQRHYVNLRTEGDNIIQLIRELNSSAVARDNGAEDAQRFHATLDKMHNSVNRMSELASEDIRQGTSASEQLV